MDKVAYVKLLEGEGKQYKKIGLYMLSGKAATVEERAAGKICAPPKLNPAYATDPKVRRVGKIVPRELKQTQQPKTQQQQRQYPPEVLRLIYGQ
ncbi:Hypothetical predicted protein [Paramuricea clavata]|uniref:Uncharacterized protein n=1 Tax=Paramuricea clavata TaxID=317549 RepID=A0A6S7FPL3_PARCT|nr:Hypothetical predicted protein [Paramuricea clavata]